MATTIRVPVGSFSWLWPSPRKQRVHGFFRRIHAFLVQSPILSRGFGEYSCCQRISWNNKETDELRKGFHIHCDFSSSILGSFLPVQLR